jgi:Zn-dependent metalloprotease
MSHTVRIAAVGLFVCCNASLIFGQSAAGQQAREAALSRLETATGGAAVVTDHKATGAARFVRVEPGSNRSLGNGRASSLAEKQQHSNAFFRDYGALIGVSNPQGMRFVSADSDAIGETHLTWHQFHGEVPVFAGMIKTHFSATHELKAVTGTAIPDIDVSTTPAFTRQQASSTARAAVVAERGELSGLRIGTTALYVYREGLAQGVDGPNHLAWEVEITDGAGVRDLVYVGAHSNKIIDKVVAVHDQLNRRAFDGHELAFVPANYPQGAYWLENQSLPTNSVEANNMIVGSKETYDLFSKAFGRDSFDNKGTTMDSIFNRGYDCPNASWNGTFISFCPGFTTDDITAHEWAHAYTQYTHGLIYQWQPGALNEAYSDIWGEVVDQINQRDENPFLARNANACSALSPPVTRLTVNAPVTIAGDYLAQAASFGGALTTTGVTRDVVAAVDAVAPAADGCTAFSNAAAVSGKIALVDRGSCEFGVKALNAQNAGAVAVIVADNQPGLILMGPGAVGAQVTIPAVSVQQTTGASLRTALAAGAVNATLLNKPGTDVSAKWLMGEDVPDGGASRDMWNPTCYSNPGKVSDPYYFCSASDQGGVHVNSGVPNHAFALLVDGGTYNGRTVSSIGMTKAAHIYYRAQSVYQVFDSDFADHADALDASCADLTGRSLTALTGGPSSEVISAADCAEVTDAIAAVELRRAPSCSFAPLLAPGNPAACNIQMTSGVSQPIVTFNFDSDPMATWTADHTTTSSNFTPRDWKWVSLLPPTGRTGGLFAESPNGGVCGPDGENGVLHLTSPEILLPPATDFARATFDHWVATEPGWDGGNLEVSVNGAAWQLVPPSEFTFNNYTAFLFSAADGNTNPLAGQPAWTGNNAGTVNGGSWGRTQVNLGNFAGAGDTVRLRWNYGTDGCAGRQGWYIDTVSLFSCAPRVPSVIVADVSGPEGNAGESDLVFTVRFAPEPIPGAPANTPTGTIKPVTVTYEVVEGSALHGNDFDRVSGTVVIPASTATALFTSATVTVKIKGDVVPEGNETFTLRILSVTNATIGDGEATATIVNDDVIGKPTGQ